jgi:hypothetical protein
MAINLIDAVMDNLKGPVLEQLGSWIGESPEKTREVTNGLVPTILAGLAEKVAEPEGSSLFGTILDQVDDGLLDKLGSVFKGDAAEKVSESGGGLLTSLFGENLLTTVIAGVAGAAGLGSGKVKTLLGFLAPVALGALKRLITRKGLSLSWLVSLFAKQKGSITNMLPKGVGGLLTAAATAAVAAVGGGDEEPVVEAS